MILNPGLICLVLNSWSSFVNRKELFDAAISRLKKAVIFNEVELDKFRDIGEQVEKLVKLKNLEDQDFEDAPDEFKVSLGRVISPSFFSYNFMKSAF